MASVMPRVGSNWLKMGQKAMVSAIWSIDIAMLNRPPKYASPIISMLKITLILVGSQSY